MTSPAIRVLIIANDSLTRAGLGALLESQPGWTVTGQLAESSNWETDLTLYRPDVILWDLGWKPLEHLEALAEAQEYGVPLVALVPDEADASAVWQTGVRGLLLRDTTSSRLAAALSSVVQGLITLEPALSYLATIVPHDSLPQLIEGLTPRELEVLQHLAQGMSNKAIALQLDISEHTVKFHVNAIMSKLSAQSRTEAVVRATQLGLILL